MEQRARGASENSLKPPVDNFRKHYYSAIGLHSGEVKPAYELVLQQETIDLAALRKLCTTHPAPEIYRNLVWKLLLGALPCSKEAWDFTEKHGKQLFSDLYRAAQALSASVRPASEQSALGDTLIYMCYLSKGISVVRMRKRVQRNVDSYGEMIIFKSIASVFVELCDSDTDSFFLLRAFLTSQQLLDPSVSIQENPIIGEISRDFIGLLISQQPNILKLLNRLSLDIHAISFRWFGTYFSECIAAESLAKVWDFVIGGNRRVLSFLALGILITVKRRLESNESAESMIRFLTKLPDADSDAIVFKAFELWRLKSAS